MDTSLILRKVSFLKALIDLKRDAIDAGPHPMTPDFAVGIAEYAVAELVRHISVKLPDRETANKLHTTARELAASASTQLVTGFDDGGDLCPPWRFIDVVIPLWPAPEPPHPNWKFGPLPDPWVELGQWPQPWLEQRSPAMTDILLAHALRELGSLTTNAKASEAIRQAGESIIKAAASRLFDDYCLTPVKPRVPIPKKKVVAA